MEINQVKFAKVVEAAKAKAADHPEWLRAIEKAAAAILSGKMLVTPLAHGALVTTDGGTYTANGACNCAARTRHCYHRAGVRLMELYEIERDNMDNHESQTIRVEEIAKGDIIHVYDTTFRVDHLHDISMAPSPHRYIHIEGARLSNGSRVGLNLYALDTVERVAEPDTPPAPRAPEIVRSVERDVVTRHRVKVVRCDGWII